MKKYFRYAFLIFFALVIVLSFFIVKPFITAILSSFVVVYIFHPLSVWLEKRTSSRNLAAFTVLLIIILVIGLFSTLFVREVYREVDNLTRKGTLLDIDARCSESGSITCRAANYLVAAIKNPDTKKAVMSTISKISTSLIVSIPSFLLNIIIFIFTTFYLIRDREKIMAYLSNALPLKKSFKELLRKQTDDLFFSTIYGTLIIAIIQGVIGIAAFAVFDSTDSPFFWGLMMAVAALIPFVGTGLVWVPMGAFQMLGGYLGESSVIMWKGAGLLIVGALIISTVDNLLKPKIIGNRAGMHPLLIMLGAFGGIALMGFIGVFIGPLILAFFMSFLSVYKKERTEIFEG